MEEKEVEVVRLIREVRRRGMLCRGSSDPRPESRAGKRKQEVGREGWGAGRETNR